MDQWWIITDGWLALEKATRLIEQRGLKVEGRGSRKGESPTIPPRVICFPPSSLNSYLSCLPSFLHCVIFLSFWLLHPPEADWRVSCRNCFPFSIIPASSSKGGWGGWRWYEARGTKHLITDRRNTTLQGQQFFDHSLALSAKKRLGRFISSVQSEQWDCVNTAKRKNYVIMHTVLKSANAKWHVDHAPSEQHKPAFLHNVPNPHYKENSPPLTWPLGSSTEHARI